MCLWTSAKPLAVAVYIQSDEGIHLIIGRRRRRKGEQPDNAGAKVSLAVAATIRELQRQQFAVNYCKLQVCDDKVHIYTVGSVNTDLQRQLYFVPSQIH